MTQQQDTFKAEIGVKWIRGESGQSYLCPAAIPYYRKAGAPMFFAQTANDFFGEGLDYYITAKLLWDTGRDVDAIVDDYCRAAFGPAADVMKTYYRRLEEEWADSTREMNPMKGNVGNPEQYLAMFTPSFEKEINGLLDQALAATDEGEYRDRVEWMREGWGFAKRELAAFRPLIELARADVLEKYNRAHWIAKRVADLTKVDVPRETLEPLIRRTIKAWRERDAYVEAHKDRFLFDARMLRAWNCTDYRFHPIEAFEKALAEAGWTKTKEVRP